MCLDKDPLVCIFQKLEYGDGVFPKIVIQENSFVFIAVSICLVTIMIESTLLNR